MREFRELESQLRDLGCPLCSSESFSLRWRSGPDPEGVDASCVHCGTVFAIDKESVSYRLPSLLRHRLQKYGCIHCGSHFTRISFRCEIDAYTHFFVVLCQDCSKTFALTGGRRSETPGFSVPPKSS